MIEVQNVSVRFGGVVALSEVSTTFSKPVSGIIGPNGAGKTTLMNVFSGFVAAAGAISCGGQDLTQLAPHKRAHWGLRRSFQKEEIANDLTVFENVLVQIDNISVSGRSRADEVVHMLKFVGLSDKANVLGENLNTFERRLTDVAKCLVGKPRVIMFDEPAGGMSVDETHQLGELIKGIHAEIGAQTLVIDHDVDLIRQICEETLVLDFGRKIAFGETDAVLADPKVKAAYLGIEEV
jgi:branched-chain amino acid transport system ATP-binding protein